MPDQFTLGPEFKGFKKMLRKDLAVDLGISGAMVSKLAKRGMPTDSLERAQRWRKRHLEPGRVKGVRFDPNYIAPAQPASAPAPPPAEAPEVCNGIVLAAELAGRGLAVAIQGRDDAFTADALELTRQALRELPDAAAPRLPLRAWIALCDHVLSDQAPVRLFDGQGAALSPDDFAEAVHIGLGDTNGLQWFDIARDWAGRAALSFEEDFNDDSEDQYAGEK